MHLLTSTPRNEPADRFTSQVAGLPKAGTTHALSQEVSGNETLLLASVSTTHCHWQPNLEHWLQFAFSKQQGKSCKTLMGVFGLNAIGLRAISYTVSIGPTTIAVCFLKTTKETIVQDLAGSVWLKTQSVCAQYHTH